MLVKLSVQKLMELWDPREAQIWFVDPPISSEEIQKAIDEGRLRDTPVPELLVWSRCPTNINLDREKHIERIAFFVVNGWSDAISFDFGVSEIPDWAVVDGNHRYRAAVFQGYDTILASVSGAESLIESFMADEEVLVSSVEV